MTQTGNSREGVEPRGHGWIVIALVAAMSLVVGVGVGLLLQDDDDTPEPLFVAAGHADAVNGELTDRQSEMVDVAEQYVEAWIAKDGDAVASFMVADGYVEIPGFDRTVYADDGSLQEWVAGLGQIPNELNDPMMVYDDHVALTGQAAVLGDTDWVISIEFTTSGDVKIVSDTHWGF